MTTLSRHSDRLPRMRRLCVGYASESPLPGMRSMHASAGPSPYGADASSEPPADASTYASAAPDTHLSGSPR